MKFKRLSFAENDGQFNLAPVRNWLESGRDAGLASIVSLQADSQWAPFFDSVSRQLGLRAFKPGAKLQGIFEGRAFGFNAVLHAYSGIVRLVIDGHEWRVDLHQAHQGSIPDQSFVVDGLQSGRHAWTIEVLEKSGSALGNEAILLNLLVDSQSQSSAGVESPEYTSEQLFARLNALDVIPGVDVVNIFCKKTKNSGDLGSSPLRYAPFLRNARQFDMFDWHPRHQSSLETRLEFQECLAKSTILLGGGGLLENEYFAPALEFISESANQGTVIWGAGHNDPSLGSWSEIKKRVQLNASRHDLIGIRDDQNHYPWVPCVSCLHPAFDAEVEVKRPVGVVTHGGHSSENSAFSHYFAEYTKIDNNQPIEKIIKFIQESELVVTNSYHGAYWSILSARRVVAVPSSSKFYDLKWQIPLCNMYDWRRAAKLARNYPKALAQARYKNVAFAESFHALLLSRNRASTKPKVAS